MTDSSAQGGEKSGGSMTRVLVVMASLMFVALIGVIVVLVMVLNRGETQVIIEQQPEPQQRTTLVQPENVDEVVDEMVSAPPSVPVNYEAVMNTTWHFPDGASPSSDAYVENASSNSTDIYFDLLRRDTGETIYASPVIPLGMHIQNFALDTPLQAGSYDCMVTYHMIDEEQNTLGTLNVAVTVIVER